MQSSLKRLTKRRIRFRGSTVSNTELSEFFGAHRVLGSELSEFLSAYYVCVCAKANSPSFSQNSPSLPQNSVSSLFRNSTLETVFRPFPIREGQNRGPRTLARYPGKMSSNWTSICRGPKTGPKTGDFAYRGVFSKSLL